MISREVKDQTTFREYTFHRRKKHPCPECGELVPRRRSFTVACSAFTTPAWMTREQAKEYESGSMLEWSLTADLCTMCAADLEGADDGSA